MLDMGFIPDIERICKLVPFTRQTLFFSATMPPEIKRLTEQVPAQSGAHRGRPAGHGRQHDHAAPRRRRPRAARQARSAAPAAAQHAETSRTPSSSATASATCSSCYKSLERHGFNVAALHGDMDQRGRMAALDAFRNGAVAAPRGQRRRRARPRHPRRQPRLQFRRAAPRRGLRPPHRPHRPRRPQGHRLSRW